MNKVTQRDAFWSKIYDMQKKSGNIVVVTADMGAPALDQFRLDFAHHFVNTGIAEQNANPRSRSAKMRVIERVQ